MSTDETSDYCEPWHRKLKSKRKSDQHPEEQRGQKCDSVGREN